MMIKHLPFTIVSFIFLLTIMLIYTPSLVQARCSSFDQDYSSCLSRKDANDPTSSTLCSIEAGNNCPSVERSQREPAPVAPLAPPAPTSFSGDDSPDAQAISHLNDSTPVQAPPAQDQFSSVDDQDSAPAPAQIPQYTPTRPRSVTRVNNAPATPSVTCQSGDSTYFPGQKRYECNNPRDRGTCNSDAGYGTPFVCNGSGNWDPANSGEGECSTDCAADYSQQSCPYVQDTCIYSQERDDGQGTICYSGTGGYGFNPPANADGSPGCNYSCGPVDCPILSSGDIPQYTPADPDGGDPAPIDQAPVNEPTADESPVACEDYNDGNGIYYYDDNAASCIHKYPTDSACDYNFDSVEGDPDNCPVY